MANLAPNMVEPIGGFEIQGMMMSYNIFMPRLYNWCRSLGFETRKIMPSRAFCSDESQGYPIIMIAKHFGAFPFDHGRVGGIVATGRHAPHADHGEDIMIIHASHVGYDQQAKTFGNYRRLQTHDQHCSPNCGKIYHTLQWYLDEYRYARQNILLHNQDGTPCLIIDNHLLRSNTENSLLLHLEKLLHRDNEGHYIPMKMLNTARAYRAANSLIESIGIEVFLQSSPVAIGKYLTHHMFYFDRNIPEQIDEKHNLEHNLIRFMPQIITDPWPILTAAQINTQIEFDRTFRSIVRERAYHGKRVMFISGLNIDVSPEEGQLFPLTKFIPWSAYIQQRDGSFQTLEQKQVYDNLANQSTENEDEIDLESAIQMMTQSTEIQIDL